MNSTISEWLQTPKISPILLALNLTRLTPIPDCEAAGSFAADFRRLLLNDTATLPLTSLTIFHHSYPDISLTNVTLGQLGDWLSWIVISNWLYHYGLRRWELLDAQISYDAGKLLRDIEKQCKDKFCSKINWTGDPDLSGVGLYAINVVLMTLTTGLSVVYAFRFMRAVWKERSGKPWSTWSDLAETRPPPEWKRLDDSLHSFWIFTVFFTYGITMAGIILDSLAKTDPMAYKHWFSYREAHLSFMVLMALWPWYRRQNTYPRLTVTGLGILFIILATTRHGYSGYASSHEESIYEWRCVMIGDVVRRFSDALFIAQFFLLIWMGSPILLLLEGRISARTTRKYLRLLRRCIPVLTASLAFVLMWMDMIIYAVSRLEMNYRAGPSYQENKWTFGQIAAVTALLPLLADFYRIWLSSGLMVICEDLYESTIPSGMREWIQRQLADVQRIESTQAGVESRSVESDVENERKLSTLHFSGSESQQNLVSAAG